MYQAINSFFGSEAGGVVPQPYQSRVYAGFLVKNWNLSSQEKFVFSEFDLNDKDTLTLSNENEIFWREQNGAIAQANNDPRSEFENHAIVEFGGKYYDPSYGSSTTNTKNDYENGALEGFGTRLLFNRVENGMPIRYVLHWVGHLNNSSQLQANIIRY